MAEKSALQIFLKEKGLKDSKWIDRLQLLQITHPDDILKLEKKDEACKMLCSLANSAEKKILEKMFNPPIEKVHKALIEVGLDVAYWSKVFAMQAGIITAQAISYMEDELYPHLAQFARYPEEKKALQELLNVEREESSFPERYKKQERIFEKIKKLSHKLIIELKGLQAKGREFDSKEVEEVKERILETLQVPQEFWYSENTFESFISCMEAFCKKMASVMVKREVLKDTSIIQRASDSLALKGVLINFEDELQDKKVLVKVPDGVTLNAPFHYQHVRVVHFVEGEEPEWLLKGLRKKRVIQKAKQFTIKCFTVPLASCYFKTTELKLTDEAVKNLQTIEKSAGKEAVLAKCKKFFYDFGSHACLGPFHFGGQYWWYCCTSNIQKSDTTVKALHKEIISTQGTASSPVSDCVANMTGVNAAKYSEKLTQQSFLKVTTIGGPQENPSVAVWKNCLVVENNSWELLDRGRECVPVWEIVKMNHAHELKNASLLTQIMQEVWEKMCHKEADELIATLCDKEDLSTLLQKKEELMLKGMNIRAWSNFYLSKESIWHFLTAVMDAYVKHDPTRSQDIRRLMRQIVGPIDQQLLHDFPERESICKWISESEPDSMVMHNHFNPIIECIKLVLERFPTDVADTDAFFEIVNQPEISLKSTEILLEAFSHLQNHLHQTKQLYDEIFISIMLFPFNYEPDRNIFLSCLSFSDIYSLHREFKKSVQEFLKVKDQKNVRKLQAHLILLALKDLDVTRPTVKYHLKYVQKMMSDDVDTHIRELLTKLTGNTSSFEDIQTQLQFILQDDPVNASTLSTGQPTEVVLSETDTKSKCMEFFQMLKLTKFFPQKMSIHDAREVWEEISGSDTVTECSDPERYPLLMIQKIMSFNIKCRMKLVTSASGDCEDAYIHPLDGLLAVLHCADNFLRQDLICKLATCHIAFPLLLPDPMSDQVTFTLWAMRTIVKQWKSGSTSYELPIVSYPSPIVSFMRVGMLQRSKSHMINVIINDSSHDTFFHYDLDGGSAKQRLVSGLVEVGWYFPSTTNKTFDNAITFTNMHGDARLFSRQVNFLSEISFMCIVFLNEDDLDERGHQVLQKLSKAPGGLVLLKNNDSGHVWHDEYMPLRQNASCSVIKLDRKNNADIKRDIKEKIVASMKSYWKDSETHPTFEKCGDIAKRCQIRVDEDECECREGKKLAFDFKEILKFQNPNESPRNMLPLQSSELWHEWASKEKEKFRQKHRKPHTSQEVYTQEIEEHMKSVRVRQLSHVHNQGPLMMSFINSLLLKNKNVRKYYLHWLKMILDEFTRTALPRLHKKYQQMRDKLFSLQSNKKKDDTAILECKREMEDLNKKLVGASFGLEHLLREIGQLYETITFHRGCTGSLQTLYIHFPCIAAELLIEGYPLELMDGDAVHIPITWITAVLQHVQKLLHNPSILVISVLGLQSTGKSTLLNTLFGVQFGVSAGRCTRGAFMQLIPLHKKLRKNCKYSYFLVIDTEGLRAPELEAMKTQQHDNQLATFVIGLANLTIINIYGEVPGDIKDILQTSVHAFLRMKAVKLNPACHFVHQNVSAVAASEKGVMGRSKMKENLDIMTQAAAKEEKLEREYSCFNDVIQFDDGNDISHFPGLWIGDPPMAPVNPAYSLKAIALKCHLVHFAKQQRHAYDISSFVSFLKNFWKAILRENFIFSFKNTLEIAAFSILDCQCSKWFLSFREHMMKWEDKAEMTCNFELEKEKEDLRLYADEKYTALKKDINTFFNERPEKDILINWKAETEKALRELHKELTDHAQKHCEQVWESQRAQAKVDEISKSHRSVIIQRVKQLVSKLEKKLGDKELEKRFEEQWEIWIKDLQEMSVCSQTHEESIISVAQRTLREYFKKEDCIVMEKQKQRSLEKWGEKLTLVIEKEHHYTQGFFSKLKNLFSPNQLYLAEEETKSFFLIVESYVMSKQKFNPSFFHEILQVLTTEIDNFDKRNESFHFTSEYRVDMALTVCGYAVIKFKEIKRRLEETQDPVKCLEREKKQPYLQLFKDLYWQTAQEKTAAKLCCKSVEDPITKEVFKRTCQMVVNEMKVDKKVEFLFTKANLIKKVLERIGMDLGKGVFESCSFYLRHPTNSLKCWVKTFTEEYCDYNCPFSPLVNLARSALTQIMDTFIRSAKEVEEGYQSGKEQFEIKQWTERFNHMFTGEFKLSYAAISELGELQICDIQYFTEELLDGLNSFCNSLDKKLQSLKASDMSGWDRKPYDILYDLVSGCTESCPFCHEPCNKLIKNHSDNHTVDKHRPQCLAGWRGRDSQKMVLETCSQALAKDMSFCKPGSDETHPYKTCEVVFPRWKLVEVPCGEAGLYWKYVVAKFKSQLTKMYSMEEDSVDNHWMELELSQALADL